MERENNIVHHGLDHAAMLPDPLVLAAVLQSSPQLLAGLVLPVTQLGLDPGLVLG